MRDFSALETGVDEFIKEAQATKPQPPPDLLARYRANPNDAKVRAEYRNWARGQAESMAPKVKTVGEQLSDNLAFHNTGSRAGQVISHGITDTVSGWADLVGAHGVGDRIRSAQNRIDNRLDSYMDENMRNEYRDNAFGRAAGEIGSLAIGSLIPMPKGGKLFTKVLPRMKMLQPVVTYATGPGGQAVRTVGNKLPLAGRLAGRIAGAANGTAARLIRAGGRQVSKLRGPLAPIVGKAMRKATPGLVSDIMSAGNVVANIRGTAPELRRGTNAATGEDYEGNRNLITRSKDWLNQEARARRVMSGSDRDHDIYRDWERWYKKRFSPEGEEGLLPMLRDGKEVYPSDETGALLDTPWLVHGTNGQKLYDRWMGIENAYGASKETNPFAASVLGKLFGYGQPDYHRVPALTLDENNNVQITPRPIVGRRRNGNMYAQPSVYEQAGARLDRRFGTNDNFERIGAGLAPIMRMTGYGVLPHLLPAADIYGGARSGNWGNIGSGAAMLAGSRLPVVGPWIARHPVVGTIGSVAAGHAAGSGAQAVASRMFPNAVPPGGKIPPALIRAALELDAADAARKAVDRGEPVAYGATPGYFSNTR